MSNPKPKKGNSTSSPTENPTCGMCGKKHYGNLLKGKDNCFGCGKSGHKVRDCPNVRSQDKGSGQAQASGSNEGPKKNRFYNLRSRGSWVIVLLCYNEMYSYSCLLFNMNWMWSYLNMLLLV